MIIQPPIDNQEESRKAVDKFIATAYNNASLMKFIQIAVDTFERKATTPITLHVKDGVVKGGEALLKF